MSTEGIKISEMTPVQIIDDSGFVPWIVNNNNEITQWQYIKSYINSGIEIINDLPLNPDGTELIPLIPFDETRGFELWYKLKRGTLYTIGKIHFSCNGTTVLTDILSVLGDSGNCGCVLSITLNDGSINFNLIIDNSDTNTIYLYTKLRQL
jgi:hypothetical protein